MPGPDCFVATLEGNVIGSAEVRLREYAEDCATSPVGYLEGIYVLPGVRRQGVGRALLDTAQAWAASKGCTEFASDRELSNERNGAFHEAVGFVETVRLVAYRKNLQEERP